MILRSERVFFFFYRLRGFLQEKFLKKMEAEGSKLKVDTMLF
jgi:hypothetical protein